MRLINQKYIKWLLPALFIAYYSSVSFFIHVHIEHGVTIVHSHPFSKSTGGAAHHHNSLSEIQLYHHLTVVNIADGAIHSLQLKFYSLPSHECPAAVIYPTYLKPVQGSRSLRSPPIA